MKCRKAVRRLFRALIEIGFIFFFYANLLFFYANLLMCESLDRSL